MHRGREGQGHQVRGDPARRRRQRALRSALMSMRVLAATLAAGIAATAGRPLRLPTPGLRSGCARRRRSPSC